MGGRKSYSVKRVTNKGLGKLGTPLFNSIKKNDPQDIAVTTARIATENKKQEQQFLKTASLLKYLTSPELKQKANDAARKELEMLSSKYGTDSKPLSKEENALLSFALKQSRRRRK